MLEMLQSIIDSAHNYSTIHTLIILNYINSIILHRCKTSSMEVSQFQSMIEKDKQNIIYNVLVFNVRFDPEYINIAYEKDCSDATIDGSLLKINQMDVEVIEQHHGTNEIMRALMRAIMEINKKYQPQPAEMWICVYRESDVAEWKWTIRDVFGCSA